MQVELHSIWMSKICEGSEEEFYSGLVSVYLVGDGCAAAGGRKGNH